MEPSFDPMEPRLYGRTAPPQFHVVENELFPFA